MCSILNDLKCYASITSSFRSHISNVKGKKKKKKKNNRKPPKKKKKKKKKKKNK